MKLKAEQIERGRQLRETLDRIAEAERRESEAKTRARRRRARDPRVPPADADQTRGAP
jgi:hypothetical protein